jgi:hypothetical protein
MENVDVAKLVPKIVSWLNDTSGPMNPAVHLSISSGIPGFHWEDGSLGLIFKRFFISAVAMGDPQKRIRVDVIEKSKMRGMETFFEFSPLRWIRCSIFFQSSLRFDASAKAIMKEIGYRCSEWIGNEKSDSQLGSFSRNLAGRPELILYLMHRNNDIQCDILIPVIEENNRFLNDYGTTGHLVKFCTT